MRGYLNGKDAAAFARDFTLEAPGKAPQTEEFWPNAVEGVADETPYRVTAIVDGTRYEKSGTADCLYDDGEAGNETINISIRDDRTKILTGDCPAQPR